MRVGRTSVTVRVSVEAERWGGRPACAPGRQRDGGYGETVKVTEAEVVLVAIGRRRSSRYRSVRTCPGLTSMKWISSRGQSPHVSFVDALFAGTAPDGGLYVPERLDPLPAATLERLR